MDIFGRFLRELSVPRRGIGTSFTSKRKKELFAMSGTLLSGLPEMALLTITSAQWVTVIHSFELGFTRVFGLQTLWSVLDRKANRRRLNSAIFAVIC